MAGQRRQVRARPRAGRHAERDLRGEQQRHDRAASIRRVALSSGASKPGASWRPAWAPMRRSLVVGTDKGDVFAFDTDGKARWQVKVTSEVLGPPRVADGTVVVLDGRRPHPRARGRRRQDEVGLSAHESAAHDSQLRRRHGQPGRPLRRHRGRQAARHRPRDRQHRLGGQRRHAQGRDRARAHRRRDVVADRRGTAGLRRRLPGPDRLLRNPARRGRVDARRVEPFGHRRRQPVSLRRRRHRRRACARQGDRRFGVEAGQACGAQSRRRADRRRLPPRSRSSGVRLSARPQRRQARRSRAHRRHAVDRAARAVGCQCGVADEGGILYAVTGR